MLFDDLARGAGAGLLATVPMTATMAALHRVLPARQRYPLPPSLITAELTAKAGVNDHIDRQEHLALTLANHFAYGAAAGSVYAPLARYLPLPPVAGGIVFGLAVWTVSYLGWLPALGILRPATEHPAQRSAVMIAAHIVWGTVLGVLTDRWQRRGRDG